MGALQNYPYADVHQLNLDWIIKKIREIRDKEDELDQAVSDAQGYAESAQTSAESAEINALKLESIVVTNYDEYTEAINDGEDSSYICREITISSPIALSSISQCANKSFSNGLFILNSDMFTWTSALPYANIPSFVNCTFIGNGYSLVDDNLYSLNGKFVNCNFIDCSFMRNGTFCQSARFVNCNIANLSGHTFIEAKRIYDNRFIGCQLESANGATLLEATSTVPDQITVSQLSFLNCVMESQSSPIVIMRDGDITIENCYFEANSANILQVLSSNRATLPFLMIAISKTRMETTSGVTMINVDASYETSKWGALVSDFCTINTGIFTNRRLHNFKVKDYSVTNGGTVLSSVEQSKVYPLKNSIVDFTTAGHAIVKKFPCLISFDSSDGGWHTNLYLVSLSYNNTPNVKCLSDPNKTPTITYDTNTGYCDVTLHASSGTYDNRSAVLLTGIDNNLNPIYWEQQYSGYNV